MAHGAVAANSPADVCKQAIDRIASRRFTGNLKDATWWSNMARGALMIPRESGRRHVVVLMAPGAVAADSPADTCK